ncbi:MAG: hypothetical protein J5630_00795 [Bacteroidaceae bacterium]|nr:hypothetical protein [Bacteroidaceae bacterium]
MSYNRGDLNKRVYLWNPQKIDTDTGQHTEYVREQKPIWANVGFEKGRRSLSNGVYDVYTMAMFKSDCHEKLTKKTRLECDGCFYVQHSFHAERTINECQITAITVEDIQKAQS